MLYSKHLSVLHLMNTSALLVVKVSIECTSILTYWMGKLQPMRTTVGLAIIENITGGKSESIWLMKYYFT